MSNEEKVEELSSLYLNNAPLTIYDVLSIMAEWKDKQSIGSLGGWNNTKPREDCFCLVKTIEFPKNCEYVVAEWDNDAKMFYSESNDKPIVDWEKWKLIEIK